MSRRVWGYLTIAVLAAASGACHSTPAPVAHLPVARATARTASLQSPAVPSPASRATVAPAPSALPAPALLQKPAGSFSTLAGTLTVDASYVVAAKEGNLVANNGGNVLAAGGGLLSDSGGGLVGKVKGAVGLVSNGGGGVVALASGNIIANNGSGIISEHGGGLLSDHGAGLLSDAGGNLVANNGGNIVANNGGGLVGKTKLHTLAVDIPAYGQQVIAAGMQLQAIDMTTGRALELGRDAKKQPVYAVYTNLAGGYEIYLPTGLQTNVRLYAVIPGHDDPRGHYSAITPPSATSPLALDEDIAGVTRLFREAMHEKFNTLLQARASDLANGLTDDAVDGFMGGGGTNPAVKAIFTGLIKTLFASIRANPRITPADYPDLAFLLGDVLLAHSGNLSDIDLDQTQYSPNDLAEIGDNPLAKGKAFPNMAKILQLSRETIIKLAGDKSPAQVAQLFATKPYLQRANDYRARLHPDDPKPYYVIEKPSDLADFINEEYFGLTLKAPYGCVPGEDCPSPPDGGHLSKDCDLITCFPSGGVASLPTDGGTRLAKAVALDIGLPVGDIDILAIGAKSVSTAVALHALDDGLIAQLQCLIANYNQPTPVCNGTATTAAN